MSGDVENLATLDVDISNAKAKLAELEKEFKEIKAVAAREGGGAVRDIVQSVRGDVDAAKKELKELESQQAEFERMQQRSQNIAARGLGGRRFAMELNMMGEAFGYVGDSSLTASTRIMALAGGLSMLSQIGGPVIHFFQQIGDEQHRAAEAANAHARALDAIGGVARGVTSAEDQLVTRTALVGHNFMATAEQTRIATEAMTDHTLVVGGTATQSMGQFEAAVNSANNEALAQFNVRIPEGTRAADRMSVAMAQLAENQSRHGAVVMQHTEHVGTATRAVRLLAQGWTDADTVFQRIDDENQNRHVHSLQMDEEKHQRALIAANDAATLQRAIDAQNESMKAGNASVDEYVRLLTAASTAAQRMRYDADAGMEQLESRRRAAVQRLASLHAEDAQNAQLRAQLRAGGMNDNDLRRLNLADPNAHAGAAAARESGQENRLEATLARLEIARHRLIGLGEQEHELTQRHGETANQFATRRLQDIDREIQAREHLNQLMERAFTLQAENHDGSAQEHAAMSNQFGSDLDALSGNKGGPEDGDAMRAETEAARIATASATAEAAITKASTAIQDAHEGQMDWSNQFTQVFSQNTEHNITMAQSFASTTQGMMQSATGALKSHMAAWIEGRETIGAAVKGMLHDILLQLATESAIKALFNFAEGIAAAASYRYAEAGQHFAAAGIYTAVAVAAGAGAAITTPSAAASGASSSHPPAAAQAGGHSGSTGGGTTQVVVNYNGSTYATQEHVHDAILHGVNEAMDRGGVLRQAA